MLDAGIHEVNAVLALPDQDAALWSRTQLSLTDLVPAVRAFLSNHGVQQPELTLLCGMGTHDDAARSPEGRAQRMARWRQELIQSAGVAENGFHDAPSGWVIDALQQELIPVLGPVLAVDSGIAAVLAALSIESLRDRSWNEGVTIVFADDVHTQAFMLFREKILGLYENHAELPKDALLADLKEVRLNWLPDEQVRAAGGHGCICGDFPAEAEGFRPTWILGPRREALAGAGRLVSPCGDARFERCFGMLYGLERRTPNKEQA
ncbi:MAG: hypothetical protein IKJ34_03790 [Mailhella sp.]|nr:hypothetical protein [Mailhella sp.]